MPPAWDALPEFIEPELPDRALRGAEEIALSVFEDLKWRGLLYDATEGVEERLSRGPLSLYIGFDPTAASLHVGSLLQILGLARMQRDGHRPIALVGGGTGLIGDPSGKSQERQLLTKEKVAENLEGIRAQLEPHLDFETKTNPARMVDNGDWLNSTNLVDFLRDIGKHFTVNYMLAKESVKRRLGADDGLSYTEFSYLLLQSYDFLVLFDRHDCELQMGGSDQWGNITGGAELIRRLRQKKAYGLVGPLVTTSTGVKFGKTESGTIWLDPELTSPYRFYQFWLNTADDDVVRYLKYFTWLDHATIDELAALHEEAPHRREAHRKLAEEVTAMVHGPTALDRAVRSSQVLFGGDLDSLEPSDVLEIFDDVPSTEVERDALVGEGRAVVELMADCGLTASKGAARRLVRDGGAYVNNRKVADEQARVGLDDFLGGSVLVLRQGRKKYHLVKLLGGSS